MDIRIHFFQSGCTSERYHFDTTDVVLDGAAFRGVTNAQYSKDGIKDEDARKLVNSGLANITIGPHRKHLPIFTALSSSSGFNFYSLEQHLSRGATSEILVIKPLPKLQNYYQLETSHGRDNEETAVLKTDRSTFYYSGEVERRRALGTYSEAFAERGYLTASEMCTRLLVAYCRHFGHEF